MTHRMTHTEHRLDVYWACEGDNPFEDEMISWVKAALDEVVDQAVEVSLKIVSTKEMTQLNSDYRGQDKATNVLSFPADVMDNVRGEAIAEDGLALLGDIAICLDLVRTEAKEQGKTLREHFAHLLVHGVLHLAGYDHEEDKEALIMEDKEAQILLVIGIKAPY